MNSANPETWHADSLAMWLTNTAAFWITTLGGIVVLWAAVSWWTDWRFRWTRRRQR